MNHSLESKWLYVRRTRSNAFKQFAGIDFYEVARPCVFRFNWYFMNAMGFFAMSGQKNAMNFNGKKVAAGRSLTSAPKCEGEKRTLTNSLFQRR